MTFPQSLEITVENLYDFVVSNVNVEVQLAAMLDECSQYKNVRIEVQMTKLALYLINYVFVITINFFPIWLQNPQNCDLFNECITRVKAHCLSSINKLVDRYINVAVNSTAAHHNKTLSRLKFFKTFYLSVENL